MRSWSMHRMHEGVTGLQMPRANVGLFSSWNAPQGLTNENRLPILRWLDIFSRSASFSHGSFFPPASFLLSAFSDGVSWVLFSILHVGFFRLLSYAPLAMYEILRLYFLEAPQIYESKFEITWKRQKFSIVFYYYYFLFSRLILQSFVPTAIHSTLFLE